MSRAASFSPKTTSSFRPLDTTTSLRPERLLCPSCARTSDAPPVLAGVSTEAVEFYCCRVCGGVWSHEKDMDLTLRAAGSAEWPQLADEPVTEAAASRKNMAADTPVTSRDWSCPCCNGKLVSVRDRRGSGVSVQRCLVCYGSWLEKEDLRAAVLAAGGMFSRIGKAVRTMLGK